MKEIDSKPYPLLRDLYYIKNYVPSLDDFAKIAYIEIINMDLYPIVTN